jgi:hypothetical protein
VAKTLLTLDDQEGGNGNGLEECEHEAGAALVHSSFCVYKNSRVLAFLFYRVLYTAHTGNMEGW